MNALCTKCGNHTVDLDKHHLNRWLRFQNELVANKVKYTKTEYARKYNRSQRAIEKLEPWYKTVKD